MKTIEAQLDPVISEVRAVKRAIVAECGGDLDAFFAGIRRRQAANPQLVKTVRGEAGNADQPLARAGKVSVLESGN